MTLKIMYTDGFSAEYDVQLMMTNPKEDVAVSRKLT